MRNQTNTKTLIAALAMVAIAVTGCSKSGPKVNRVQVNLVDKDVFEGEWWMTQTVVDTDTDATRYSPTYSGDMGWTDYGLDKGQSGAVAKIRWVIDEDFLFAYRSFELIEGGNTDGDDPEFRGQPIAAYEIVDHVDVRRDYNPVTGESLNIVEENTSDRRWFERDFMRVDWAKNHIKSYYFTAELNTMGGWKLEPGEFFIQDGNSHKDFPKAWEPQQVTVGQDPTYRFANEWSEEDADKVHYLSFVSMLNLSPGESCLFIGGGPCQTFSVPHRTAFLRVPPNHQYDAATQTHNEFDRFGVFRTYQRTYTRGGQNTNVASRRCDADDDCGSNGFCDPERRVCAGGITGDYGETDALRFLRPKHNFFEKSLTETTCVADWECDGRFEDTPGIGAGSVCDQAADRCTIPMKDRTIRQSFRMEDGELVNDPGAVAYYLNAGYPAHLVKPAYEVVGNWNEVFMRGWRAARDLPLPDYSGVSVQCQTANPTAYCFCGSPDDLGGGTCAGRYDPFTTPDQAAAQGVVNPYACHVENVAGFEEPGSPQSYDEYALPQAYRYRFVGDECMFVLRTNSCDWHRDNADVSCDDVTNEAGDAVVFEQLGDLRYQFFNYIEEVGTRFGGVSALRVDPTSGELVTANANFAAGSVENAATRAIEYFPVLRCANEDLGCAPGEENADELYLTGENVRGYFGRLGRVEHPATIAPSGSDGFSVNDDSRPSQPVNLGPALRAKMEAHMPRIERLRGFDGRTQILTDRMRTLAGTSFEHQLMGSLGVDGWESMTAHFDHGSQVAYGVSPVMDVHDEDVLSQISPFRGNASIRTLRSHIDAEAELSERSICTFSEGLFRSRYWEYWAEAFRGRPTAEASIRMQQLYTRMVQYHEIGHSVGLRHNFGASFDRNNYGDGFFNMVLDQGNALPRRDSFDANNDGVLGAGEYDQYVSETRRVRNERAALGVHNYTSSSTMDYAGDTADAQGLGRYDVAATLWNHFDLKETYDVRGGIDHETSVTGQFQGLHRSNAVDRVWMRSYRGGESCKVSAQCPFTKGSPALASTQPIYQRCVQNPRNVFPQQPCSGNTGCVCSSFDEDVQDYADGFYAADDEYDQGFAPVSYLFCGDERTNDVSWCNRFDAGESFVEVVDHFRRQWEEAYPLRYYRRFQRDGARGLASLGAIVDSAKIYQHLFFRFNFEPGFQFNRGPLGFEDQILASIDSMNWMIEMANLPDEGSYAFDAANNRYEFLGEQVDLPGSDMSLLPGQGFGMWTKYQDGHQGFFRPERAGVFNDKFLAMQALAIRDWGFSFTIDERFFINYYDLFPTELSEFFGGVVLQDSSWYAPRLLEVDGEPVVQHLSWYRGLVTGECTDADNNAIPCRGSQPEGLHCTRDRRHEQRSVARVVGDFGAGNLPCVLRHDV